VLCVDCEDKGFFYIESVNGSYYPQLKNLPWRVAHEYCVSYGGHLLTIENEAEQNAIAQHLTDYYGGQYQCHVSYHSGAVASTDSIL